MYGLPNIERQNANANVAKKYGIEFYSVAGCIVPLELVDSVKTENKKVYTIIEKKYGKLFWNRFEKEVDDEYAKHKKVKKLLSKQAYLQKLEQELSKENNGLNYFISPSTNEKDYDVEVYGWGKYNNESAMVSFYRLTVNVRQQTVTVRDKTVLPF
jgi:hypothetical protein